MKIFHVHTFRCHHAEPVPDEAYILKAAELGAEEIWFTDHAPFPGDPFGARMSIDTLPEYLSTLSDLKRKHPEIAVHIGLETEYFPHFDNCGYYDHLRSLPELEFLLLGQHMAQTGDCPPAYSFSESPEYLAKNEFRLLGNAIVQGAESGYFDAIAHPDRIFRRCVTHWNEDMAEVSRSIINAAVSAGIPLEMNLSSARTPAYYRREFWQLLPDNADTIVGFDAHSVFEMICGYSECEMLLTRMK